jgi:hypothetical protein
VFYLLTSLLKPRNFPYTNTLPHIKQKRLRELKNIWSLIKTGSVKTEKRNPLQMLFFIAKMLLILVLFKIISIGLIFFLNSLGLYELPINLNRARFESFTNVEVLLLLSVYGPIMEELTFRLPLKFSKWNLTIASIGITATICRVLVQLEYKYSITLSIGIGIAIYYILNKKLLENISEFWIKNKLLIFYVLLIIFSFLHLKNYDMTFELLLFSPIFMLTHILGGIFFSYVRLNSGILLAICFHSFNNGIIKIIKIIME